MVLFSTTRITACRRALDEMIGLCAELRTKIGGKVEAGEGENERDGSSLESDTQPMKWDFLQHVRVLELVTSEPGWHGYNWTILWWERIFWRFWKSQSGLSSPSIPSNVTQLRIIGVQIPIIIYELRQIIPKAFPNLQSILLHGPLSAIPPIWSLETFRKLKMVHSRCTRPQRDSDSNPTTPVHLFKTLTQFPTIDCAEYRDCNSPHDILPNSYFVRARTAKDLRHLGLIWSPFIPLAWLYLDARRPELPWRRISVHAVNLESFAYILPSCGTRDGCGTYSDSLFDP